MEESNKTITLDIKGLFDLIWINKILIVLITTVFIIVGAIYAFTAKEEYVAVGKILPEVSNSGSGGSLGGLANLVGIGGFELGLKNNTDAIRPDLYPDVLKSTPFFLALFNEKLINLNGDSLKFEEFYHINIEDNEESSEASLKLYKGKPESVIVLNRLTNDRIKNLQQRITGSIDKQSGMISISVKMPDPVIAAQIADYAMKYLTSYVTSYRTKKLLKEVDFLGSKVAAAKGEFYQDQSRKAQYSDQFASATIRLKSADIQRERIESDYKLSSSLYNELLKKYEEAKLKLQQETPIFQILEPPVAPTNKSEPRKSIILIISAIVGAIFGLLVILFIKGNYKKVFH